MNFDTHVHVKEMRCFNKLFGIFYLQIDCQLNPVHSSDLEETKEWSSAILTQSYGTIVLDRIFNGRFSLLSFGGR